MEGINYEKNFIYYSINDFGVMMILPIQVCAYMLLKLILLMDVLFL